MTTTIKESLITIARKASLNPAFTGNISEALELIATHFDNELNVTRQDLIELGASLETLRTTNQAEHSQLSQINTSPAGGAVTTAGGYTVHTFTPTDIAAGRNIFNSNGYAGPVDIIGDKGIATPITMSAGESLTVLATNLTFNGNAGYSTVQKKFGSSSYYANGSSYISCGNLGSLPSLFTVEFWFYATSYGTNANIFATQYNSSNACIRFELSPSGTLYGMVGNGVSTFGSYTYSTSIALNTWYHVVMGCNTSNSVIGFLNGVQKFSSSHSLWPTTMPNCCIGIGFDTARYFYGYVDEVRISSIARWTANFTPPTAPYEPDQYTKLLLHMESNVGTIVRYPTPA